MEKAIKQRLLGGLVLVAGAVLFLPVLLDGSGASLNIPPMPVPPQAAGVDAIAPPLEEKVQATDQAVDAAHAGRDADTPAPASAEAAPETAAVAPEAGAAETAAPPAPPAKAPAVAAVPAPKPAPQLVAPPAPKPVAKPELKAETKTVTPAAAMTAAAKPAVLPEAWVVQIASFASRDKAEALLKKLRGKKYPAVLRPQGTLWKVTVGPELSRSAADSVQARIEHDPELNLKGIVQVYKP